MDSSSIRVEGGHLDNVARVTEACKFIREAVGSLGMVADNLDPNDWWLGFKGDSDADWVYGSGFFSPLESVG